MATLAILIAPAFAGCVAEKATAESISNATVLDRPGPTIRKFARNGGLFVLEWETESGAMGYDVQTSGDGGVTWAAREDTLNTPQASGFGQLSIEGGSPVARIRTVISAHEVSQWSTAGAVSGTQTTTTPDKCVDAFEAAAADQSGTAEAAYEASVTYCGSVSRWVSVARQYPAAFALTSVVYFEPKQWLDLICGNYPDTVVCRDYAVNGV
ncbi:MAG: hypothetical protein KKC41_08745 [Actinobacteria bacterium]|nr:hypothetical protein [Actinomycetota bacterium]MBU4416960.1 hypothetical protein [Actinomycetota bacterium]MBU4588302.1 hypothetical protein [Actinomycetota bacterium]